MKTFESFYLDNDVVPIDFMIYDALEYVGYEGFVPKTFIADLLILSKYKLLGRKLSSDQNDYIKAVQNIVNTSLIEYWLRDVAYLVKRIGMKYNLRTIEQLAANGNTIDFKCIGFSYNYSFDINSLDSNVMHLLGITEDHVKEIEKLPNEVIEILSITNGLGSFLNTSKSIVSGYKQMQSYGDIVKVGKHNFADPLFNYRFSVKDYSIDTDSTRELKSDKIIIGYFLGNYQRSNLVSMLIKLLGTIVLSNFNDNVKIIIYSFHIDSYSKKELSTVDEIIDYFSTPKQLKLFPIDNSKAIKAMITENLGDDIIYLPNIMGNCFLDNNHSGSNRVNIISVKESVYNTQYQNICKKTGGRFLAI